MGYLLENGLYTWDHPNEVSRQKGEELKSFIDARVLRYHHVNEGLFCVVRGKLHIRSLCLRIPDELEKDKSTPEADDATR